MATFSTSWSSSGAIAGRLFDFSVKVVKGQGRLPRRLITDKLRSYSAAHRAVRPSVVHSVWCEATCI